MLAVKQNGSGHKRGSEKEIHAYLIVSFEAKYARTVYVFPWLKCVSFRQKPFFNEKISGEMFTVTLIFTYMNMSCFKQFETFFTDGFEICFGLNKIG